jgi:hypothetical protein
MALRVRPTLPFVRVLLGGTLGGTSNLTGAVRIIGYVDATGALTTVFTVRVGTLVTLTSQLGIRGDWNVSKAIYELLSNYLGISGKGPQLDNAEDLFETWVVNMDTKASTRYEQFDFNSFAFVDGHYFGAQQDGVYLLEGDDDHGDPIRASINFGLQNFGTSLMKHVPDVYVGVASDGRLVLKVKSDAETYFYTQRDASRVHAHATLRPRPRPAQFVLRVRAVQPGRRGLRHGVDRVRRGHDEPEGLMPWVKQVGVKSTADR